jgi:pyruvate dehydrogenase E2 component (dihydrolipoamide acetyltransferase)
MDRAVRYIEEFRAKTGKKITVTHLVAKALAHALSKCPDANALLRWNRIYLRSSIDLSILVLIAHEGDGKFDLSAAKVANVDKLSLRELAETLEKHVEKVRARQDAALEKTRSSMAKMPFLLMNAVLKVISFLCYTLNLDLRWAGLPKDAFGSAMITSIGSIGLDIGYVPLVPYSRCPILIAPGNVGDEPVVDDGKVVPGKMMNLNATFDHRIIDGAHAAVMAKALRAALEDPYAFFDKLDGAGAEVAAMKTLPQPK